ncbi:MAG TPA: multiheme c-type cytochrome, partial [Planctomycetaceae bacterium]|nr:multiheme c-type cytochrome [Planctomycetaceae bacterium]
MPRRFTILAGLIALALVGVWVGRTAWHRAPDRTTSGTARFAGSAACVSCHESVAERYNTSGHARTFSLAENADVARLLAGKTFDDPKWKQIFHYHLDGEGLSASLPDTFGDKRFPLTYALGSGTHAVTFLTLLPRRDGATVGLEHRMTFYRQLEGLGLTVGHPYIDSPAEDVEHFGKVVDERQLKQCIGCHTTQAKIENHQLVNVIPHVGCESCHGPGSDHVEAQQAGQTNTNLSVANRWPTGLDELKTCGACHRLPESLKASELVRTSRVLPRFQPAGLMQSRCYKQSEGTMRCTTCHDPHAKVS